MLQKCSLYIKGFMQTSTMIILLILMVTYYFYQDKIKEVSGQWLADNKQNGTLFYINGIWDNLKGAQQLQDDRNNRAYELLGKTKIISEKSGLFTLEVPETWIVSDQQAVVGNQISKFIIASPVFSQRNDGPDIFYDNGAQLTVDVVRGEQSSAKLSDGGHGKMLLRKENVEQGGVISTFYVFNDPVVKSGELLDANVVRGGNTYNFSFVFNPANFNEGEFSFQNILGSVKFRDNK